MTYTAHVDTFARDNLPPRELWPDLVFDLPELQYPQRLNCATRLLDDWVARGHGDHPAIHSGDETLSYKELQARVDRVARVLTEDMGLVPGNRVLLRGYNNAWMAVCWLAALKAGLIAVTTMPLLRAKELAEVIEKARVGAALCDKRLDGELLAAGRQCPVLAQTVYFGEGAGSTEGLEARAAAKPPDFPAVDTAAEDTALIAFTSGTTGRPKGTMHFHRDLLAICDTFARHIARLGPDDVSIGTPPLAFTFGLGGLLVFPLWAGGAAVLLEKPTPEAVLRAIGERRATVTWSSPVFYRMMAPLVGQFDLTSLRKSVSAGEALPAATRALWRDATGIEMIDGIGATEMLHIFISAAGAAVRPGATGRPVPGYRACVLDDAAEPLPPGSVGRLAVKGPTGCRYLADERQREYAQGGWNVTGDAYLLDEDGYFWFQARTDDMIIAAGYNVAGPEVEEALLKHPAVAECAVVGAPDDERGQVVKAYVVPRDGYAPDGALVKALQDFVKGSIAPYKYPRAIEFCASLPRTETGKLQRFKLRQLAYGMEA